MVRRLPKEFRPLVLDFLAKNFGHRGIDALSIERAVTNTVNDLKKLQNDSVMGYFKEDAANKAITNLLAINTAIAKVTGLENIIERSENHSFSQQSNQGEEKEQREIRQVYQ